MKLKRLFIILFLINCSACSPGNKEQIKKNETIVSTKTEATIELPDTVSDNNEKRIKAIMERERLATERRKLDEKKYDKKLAAYENSPFIVRHGKIEVLEQYKPLTKFQGYHHFLIEQAYESAKHMRFKEGTKAMVSYERSKTIVLFQLTRTSGEKTAAHMFKVYINPDTGEVISQLMGP